MERRAAITAALCLGALATGTAAASTTSLEVVSTDDAYPRSSIAVGTPQRGALVNGVQLPPEGEHFFTWDFPKRRAPSRPWRRWGTDRTIARTLEVLAAFRAANPGAPRVGVADISRPRGGPFGERFGGLGHASHQNGLDADLIYPRRDRVEAAPRKPRQVDRRLSQDLVRRFVRAGAKYVFVGPRLRLGGPRRIVQRLVHHDDHLHVRFRP